MLFCQKMALHLKYSTCFPSVLTEWRREKLICQNKAVMQEKGHLKPCCSQVWAQPDFVHVSSGRITFNKLLALIGDLIFYIHEKPVRLCLKITLFWNLRTVKELINKLAAAELCCSATADGSSWWVLVWILNLTIECDGQTGKISPSLTDLFNNKPFSNREAFIHFIYKEWFFFILTGWLFRPRSSISRRVGFISTIWNPFE